MTDKQTKSMKNGNGDRKTPKTGVSMFANMNNSNKIEEAIEVRRKPRLNRIIDKDHIRSEVGSKARFDRILDLDKEEIKNDQNPPLRNWLTSRTIERRGENRPSSNDNRPSYKRIHSIENTDSDAENLENMSKRQRHRFITLMYFLEMRKLYGLINYQIVFL